MHYNDFGHWIRQQFPFRVQKLSVDAGFSCPNRDGKISTGGCVYCNNKTFNPSYCDNRKTIREQLEAGKTFFARKYPTMRYLAYFQAFTNTYDDLDTLKRKYEEALTVDDIVGIVIGTRPDCMPEDLLDYLETLHRQVFVLIEYGIESTRDVTLRRINRGHDFACTRTALERTAERQILCGGHIIIGLPGESREDILDQAPVLSSLPLNILKIHQMQIIKGTPLDVEFRKDPTICLLHSVDEYIQLIGDYLPYLRKDLVLERFVSQSPKDLLTAPQWGLKNHEFTARLNKYLKEHNIFQGSALP